MHRPLHCWILLAFLVPGGHPRGGPKSPWVLWVPKLNPCCMLATEEMSGLMTAAWFRGTTCPHLPPLNRPGPRGLGHSCQLCIIPTRSLRWNIPQWYARPSWPVLGGHVSCITGCVPERNPQPPRKDPGHLLPAGCSSLCCPKVNDKLSDHSWHRALHDKDHPTVPPALSPQALQSPLGSGRPQGRVPLAAFSAWEAGWHYGGPALLGPGAAPTGPSSPPKL